MISVTETYAERRELVETKLLMFQHLVDQLSVVGEDQLESHLLRIQNVMWAWIARRGQVDPVYEAASKSANLARRRNATPLEYAMFKSLSWVGMIPKMPEQAATLADHYMSKANEILYPSSQSAQSTQTEQPQTPVGASDSY